ncbi:hypothetical protein [Actinacidiphila sp. bgisy160]|uniref:hypothetical protein n=1 Tax=Actinacidiphila sp. bgisy160 TaxID=3413796 RepID=UPI003D756C7D
MPARVQYHAISHLAVMLWVYVLLVGPIPACVALRRWITSVPGMPTAQEAGGC